jgi:hypothetical protein
MITHNTPHQKIVPKRPLPQPTETTKALDTTTGYIISNDKVNTQFYCMVIHYIVVVILSADFSAFIPSKLILKNFLYLNNAVKTAKISP